MNDKDRAERATLVLAILRKLDTASLDEVRVVDRVVDRFEALRRPGAGLAGIDHSELDSALLLELSDMRLERERSDAQHEADRDQAVGPAMCLGRVHGGRYCTADAHLPSCAVGTADDGRRVCPVGGEG